MLNKLVKSGIDSLKIEGRVRSPEYVSTVTKVYKNAINAIDKKKFNAKLIKDSMVQLPAPAVFMIRIPLSGITP